MEKHVVCLVIVVHLFLSQYFFQFLPCASNLSVFFFSIKLFDFQEYVP